MILSNSTHIIYCLVNSKKFELQHMILLTIYMHSVPELNVKPK